MKWHSPTFSFHDNGSLFSSFESSDMANGILVTYVNTEEAAVTTDRSILMPLYFRFREEYFPEN